MELDPPSRWSAAQAVALVQTPSALGNKLPRCWLQESGAPCPKSEKGDRHVDSRQESARPDFGRWEATGFNIYTTVFAVIGAVIVLVIYHAASGRRTAKSSRPR